MIQNSKEKLTLDKPVTYQIQVPGKLDVKWSDWRRDLTVAVIGDENDFPVSILTGIFDQAALQGFLRRLYSFGLPLISIKWIETNDKN